MITQGSFPRFARVFYRNAINIGPPIFQCPQAAQDGKADKELSIDFETGLIRNPVIGKACKAESFPPFFQNVISSGGLTSLLKGGQK